MKNTVYLVLVSFFSVAAYVALYAAKRWLFPGEIVLTEGLQVMVVFLPALVIVLVLLRKVRAQPEIGAAVFLISFLAAAGFNLTVPAIFDRSVTVYLLNHLDNAGVHGMTEEEVQREFMDVYFHSGNYAIRKRLGEQVHGGNLAYDGDRYRITGRGRATIGIARWISRLFRLDPRIVEQR